MAKKSNENDANLSEIESGGSELLNVEGREFSFEEVSMQDFMAYPEIPPSPSWKTTRYPVGMEEFKAMCLEAQKLDVDPNKSMSRDPMAAMQLEEGQTDEGMGTLDFPEDAEDPQMPTLGAADLAPAAGHSFRGIPATGWQPADCAIGVGNTNDVLLGVNVELADYRKAGALRFRWPNFTTLFSRVLPPGAFIFDPQVAFDHYAKRWIVVLAARRDSPRGSWCLLGVSKTNDPGGAWYTWALDASVDGSAPSNNWMDYPQLGFDTQAIYISMNQFNFSSQFQYTKVRILNKAQVYAGGSIGWYDFWNLANPDGSKAFTVLPCRHYRGTGGNPNAYLVNALWPGGRSLTMWTLTDPIGYWSGRTPGLSRKSVSCSPYELPPDALQRGGGTAQRINTNDSRLMNAVFQHAGGTQRIWTCHCDKGSWAGDSEARSVIQWYEIDVPSATVVQQNAYGAPNAYYYFPAIQTDVNRNVHLVFGRSSATEYASLRQTGRRVAAALGSMEGSALVKAGESTYLGGRWGDYFGICRDGSDANRVWGFGMYAAARGSWGTWVYSAKF